MLVVRRVVIFLLLIITVIMSGCNAREYRMTSQPINGKDGSVISAEEREMIQGLAPFFVAISNKDVKKMKEINPGMRNITDEQLVAQFATVKKYIFQGVEDVTYKGGMLKAIAIYSGEIIKPGTIGENIAPYKTNVEMIREGSTWIISGWTQIENNGNDMEYFKDIFTRIERTEKRYGVKDLAKWDGL